jgi:hypothetical protein
MFRSAASVALLVSILLAANSYPRAHLALLRVKIESTWEVQCQLVPL